MNAYKLANELKRCIDDGFTDLVCVSDAVNVIRQQADRIAELEKQTNPLAYEEIAEIWKKLWQGGNIGHIAYTYAKAIEERHGIK